MAAGQAEWWWALGGYEGAGSAGITGAVWVAWVSSLSGEAVALHSAVQAVFSTVIQLAYYPVSSVLKLQDVHWLAEAALHC